MKVTVRILLTIASLFMATLCVLSVVIPINFEETRTKREADVVKNLIALRTAEVEFRNQKGYFTADLDSLVLFLKTAPKRRCTYRCTVGSRYDREKGHPHHQRC